MSVGIIFLQEAKEAWLSQSSRQKSQEYSSCRAMSEAKHLIQRLSQLPTDVRQLTQLGFPEIAGFHSLPKNLFEDACSLATQFLNLVVQAQSCLAWDFTFWCTLWPNAFASILHPEKQRAIAAIAKFHSMWKRIEGLEKILFPKKPQSSTDVVAALSVTKYPELAQLYTCLEGVAWQYTREVIALLSEEEWVPDDCLQSEELMQILKDSFAIPLTTKSWTEDIFRDMRRHFKETPDAKAEPWSRQKAAINSLLNRDRDCLMPFFGQPTDESLQMFHRFKQKALITTSVFSPLANPRKVKRCHEHGKMFDVGYPTSDARPIVDLTPLKDEESQRKKARKKASNDPDKKPPDEELPDALPLMLLPSSKLAAYVAASAYQALLLYPEFIDRKFDDLERKLGGRWQGQLLRTGQVYELGVKQTHAVCLGYYGYAAMFLPVQKVSLFDDLTFFSFLETWHFR